MFHIIIIYLFTIDLGMSPISIRTLTSIQHFYRNIFLSLILSLQKQYKADQNQSCFETASKRRELNIIRFNLPTG